MPPGPSGGLWPGRRGGWQYPPALTVPVPWRSGGQLSDAESGVLSGAAARRAPCGSFEGGPVPVFGYLETSAAATPCSARRRRAASLNPSAGSPGIVGTLAVCTSPVASSTRLASVKVPPMSNSQSMRHFRGLWRRKYRLSTDQRERKALEMALAGGTLTVLPDSLEVQDSLLEESPLGLLDDNGNGWITCAEARSAVLFSSSGSSFSLQGMHMCLPGVGI